MQNNIEDYLLGKKLYGDDFSYDDIEKWYKEEEEGYANLGSNDYKNYIYEYHELNKIHAFNQLKEVNFKSALGIGSAYGEEFLPIISQIEKISILDPSEQMKVSEINTIPVNYIKPNISGVMDFKDNSFDLVTSFGVLHHIPNVSLIISEVKRVLSSGGLFILREPIVSMGDWRKTRKGLTKNERGIPVEILKNLLNENKFDIISIKYFDFYGLPKIFKLLIKYPFNNRFFVYIDILISFIMKLNYSYSRKGFLGKLCPSSIYIVCKKI